MQEATYIPDEVMERMEARAEVLSDSVNLPQGRMSDHEVRDAVHQVLATKILKRLEKLGASEYDELRASLGLSFEQRYILTSVIERLMDVGLITFPFHFGLNTSFVCSANATDDELQEAYERFANVEDDTKLRWEFRRELHKIEGRSPYAKRVPLTQDVNPNGPHLDPGEPGDNADDEFFGLTWEQNAAAHPYDAELRYSDEALMAERADILDSIPKKPISPIARKRIAYQDAKPWIKANNARKAKKRWLKSDEGQNWLLVKQQQEILNSAHETRKGD